MGTGGSAEGGVAEVSPHAVRRLRGGSVRDELPEPPPPPSAALRGPFSGGGRRGVVGWERGLGGVGVPKHNSAPIPPRAGSVA